MTVGEGLVMAVIAILVGTLLVATGIQCRDNEKFRESCDDRGGYVIRGNDKKLCLTHQQAVDIGLIRPVPAEAQ